MVHEVRNDSWAATTCIFVDPYRRYGEPAVTLLKIKAADCSKSSTPKMEETCFSETWVFIILVGSQLLRSSLRLPWRSQVLQNCVVFLIAHLAPTSYVPPFPPSPPPPPPLFNDCVIFSVPRFTFRSEKPRFLLIQKNGLHFIFVLVQ
jgi:hypothetical protein